MKKLLLPFVTLILLVSPTPAAPAASPAAEGLSVVSGAAAKFYGYATPLVLVEPGAQITYYNFDIEKHNVVHDAIADGVFAKKKQPWCRDFTPGKCPLFWSKMIGLGDTPIKGLQNLEAGQLYTFYCTLHPGMKGHLLAVP
jgi:plastocyanin